MELGLTQAGIIQQAPNTSKLNKVRFQLGLRDGNRFFVFVGDAVEPFDSPLELGNGLFGIADLQPDWLCGELARDWTAIASVYLVMSLWDPAFLAMSSNTRCDSTNTRWTSGMKETEQGFSTTSNMASENIDKSRMSPSRESIFRPSRRATTWSCCSCLGELSSTVMRAPAAASKGAC